MKYINKFNENISEFDVNFAMSKISENYTDESVIEMYDEELLNWVDSSWEEDGYDCEYDWYIDHNNGEAQDIVYDQIIDWYKKEFDENLSIDNQLELLDKIKEKYSL